MIDVGLNPRRTGFLEILRRMGAQIEIQAQGEQTPEPRGRIAVRHGPLRGVTVSGEQVAAFLDEVPVLAVAAAAAQGSTEFQGLAELRHKESDRLATTAELVRALGGGVAEESDGLCIEGRGRLAGAAIDSGGDHRLAMAGLVAGCSAASAVAVRNAACIATSDPGFVAALRKLGARIA
ncbi:MAG: hypothetical protein GF355_16240 [Candidatus Eisenbacteria bacterium]|nr:hypothetical protein [Candidatus Eisenbacteria bacterium]